MLDAHLCGLTHCTHYSFVWPYTLYSLLICVAIQIALITNLCGLTHCTDYSFVWPYTLHSLLICVALHIALITHLCGLTHCTNYSFICYFTYFLDLMTNFNNILWYIYIYMNNIDTWIGNTANVLTKSLLKLWPVPLPMLLEWFVSAIYFVLHRLLSVQCLLAYTNSLLLMSYSLIYGVCDDG